MKFCTAFTALFLLSISTTAHAATTGAIPVTDFVNTMGVHTNITDKTSPYANISQVTTLLSYVGIGNIREIVPQNWSNGANLQDYTDLFEAGIKFDLHINPAIDLAGNNTYITQNLLSLNQIVTASNSASLSSVEGLAVTDVNAIPAYKSNTGINAAIIAQQDLYAGVKADPALQEADVLDLVNIDATSLDNRADFANAFSFPINGSQPYTGLLNAFNNNYSVRNGLHKVITATQNFTLPTNWSTPTPWTDCTNSICYVGIDERTQAKAVLNTFLDAQALGISKTYVFELIDHEAATASTDTHKHFGLFHFDRSPKTAATALHNFTGLLTDNAATASLNTASGSALDYSIDNLPTTAKSLLLQKDDGEFALVIWDEKPYWAFNQNANTSAPVNSGPTQIMLNLAQTAATVRVYDPLSQTPTTPVSTDNNIAGKTLSLPADYPILVKIVLPPACGAHASGTSWSDTPVVTTGSPVTATLQECPHGGEKTDTITTTAVNSCSYGVTSTSNQVTHSYSTPACYASCVDNMNGTHYHGTSWVDYAAPVISTITATSGECPQFGGYKIIRSITPTTYSCTNGSTSSSIGAATVTYEQPTCNVSATSCGTHATGTSWSTTIKTVASTPTTDDQCLNGGNIYHTTTTVISYICANAVQTTTNQAQITSTGDPVCTPIPGSSCVSTSLGRTVITAHNGVLLVDGATASSTAAASKKQCPYGGTVTTTWLNQTQKQCRNGTLQTTRIGVKSNITSVIACNAAPTCTSNCGSTSTTVGGTTSPTARKTLPRLAH